MIWECTISHLLIDGEKENLKKEKYLLENCESFGEVETKMLSLFNSYTGLDVVTIKRSKVCEIINAKKNGNEKIFEATISDVFVDDNGNEKNINYLMILFANGFDEALATMMNYIKQGYNMELVRLRKTSIVDILV